MTFGSDHPIFDYFDYNAPHKPGWKMVQEVVAKLTYKNWRFEVDPYPYSVGNFPPQAFLRVSMAITNSVTGLPDVLTHRISIVPMENGHRMIPSADGIEFASMAEARRWVLERIFDIEKHEAMEFFRIDGKAPFWPDHSRPYVVMEKPEHKWKEFPKPDPVTTDPYSPDINSELRQTFMRYLSLPQENKP